MASERDYRGRRCVVTGAGSALGEALAGRLVELGAEVHAVDAAKVTLRGLASVTIADSGDEQDATATAARIGAVIDSLFDLVPTPTASSDGVLAGPSVFVLATAAVMSPAGIVVVAPVGEVASGDDPATREALVERLIDEGCRGAAAGPS
jgi:NAD(P)-dependent dehydrogenase (short-subunit alcohol dehydrogenase family)